MSGAGDALADWSFDVWWNIKIAAFQSLNGFVLIVVNLIWFGFLIFVALPVVWDWLWRLPPGLRQPRYIRTCASINTASGMLVTIDGLPESQVLYSFRIRTIGFRSASRAPDIERPIESHQGVHLIRLLTLALVLSTMPFPLVSWAETGPAIARTGKSCPLGYYKSGEYW